MSPIRTRCQTAALGRAHRRTMRMRAAFLDGAHRRGALGAPRGSAGARSDPVPRYSIASERRDIFGFVAAAVGLEFDVVRHDDASIADWRRTAVTIALINMFPLFGPGFQKRKPRRPQARA